MNRGKYSESNEPDRCGIGQTSTGKGDPFISACEWHDDAYLKGSWHQLNMSRKVVDKFFLEQMLRIAGKSVTKRARAYAYYYLARMFGGMFWEGKH